MFDHEAPKYKHHSSVQFRHESNREEYLILPTSRQMWQGKLFRDEIVTKSSPTSRVGGDGEVLMLLDVIRMNKIKSIIRQQAPRARRS